MIRCHCGFSAEGFQAFQHHDCSKLKPLRFDDSQPVRPVQRCGWTAPQIDADAAYIAEANSRIEARTGRRLIKPAGY